VHPTRHLRARCNHGLALRAAYSLPNLILLNLLQGEKVLLVPGNFVRVFLATPGETAMASLNPVLAFRWLGVRREIHPLDEFLSPAHPLGWCSAWSSFSLSRATWV